MSPPVCPFVPVLNRRSVPTGLTGPTDLIDPTDLTDLIGPTDLIDPIDLTGPTDLTGLTGLTGLIPRPVPIRWGRAAETASSSSAP